MKKVKLIYCMLVIFILVQLFSVQVVFAEESSSDSSTVRNPDGTLTVEHSYPETDEAPSLPEGIWQGGTNYVLDEINTGLDPDQIRPTKRFSRTLSSQVPLEGLNNLQAYFPATVAIDEGEFQGEIGLDPNNPFVVINRYEAFRQQVDRMQVFTGLPDNDVTRIPTTQQFEVSSASAPGATETRDLQILDVSYTIAGTDHLGLPNNYTATVIYRGLEEYLELVFYDVTANYSGELTSSIDQMTITASYSPVTPPVTTISESEVPLAEPELPLFPLAIASSMVVIILALPLLYFFVLSNARLIRLVKEHTSEMTGDTLGSRKPQESRPTSELICRRRLTLKDGIADFKIPPQVDILEGDQYYLVIKPFFASKKGSVRMVWQGKVVAVLPLAQHNTINFKQMLITSVEAAIEELNYMN